MNQPTTPEGIEDKHIHEAGGSIFRRWPFGLSGLFLLLAFAFFGVYGSDTRLSAAGGQVDFTVEGPGRARNGEFFELSMKIDSRRDIRDVVVLMGTGIWRDVTINTYMPEPAEHGFRDGSYEFRFGPLKAGDSMHIKFDAQINPGHGPTANEGEIALADGDTVLATVHYAMEVLP